MPRPGHRRSRASCWSGLCRSRAAISGMALGDLEGATVAAQAAKEAAESLSDNLTLSVSMGTLAAVKHFQARFSEGIALASRAVELADQSSGREGHRFPVLFSHSLLLPDSHPPH